MAEKKKKTAHEAQNDAFGSKKKGKRNYDSGGDRPTQANREEAAKIGQKPK